MLSQQSSKLLNRHSGRAHRLCLEPGSSRTFFSCGEDGLVYRYDMRQSERKRLVTLKDEDGDVLPCYAMSVDPMTPVYFILGGTSTYVQLFDVRSPSAPVARFAPRHLRSGRQDHVTGTAYDWTGREFVATYNDELIYRFHVDKDAVVEDEGPPVATAAASSSSSSSSTARPSKRAVGTRAARLSPAASGGAAAAAAAQDDEEGSEAEEEEEEGKSEAQGQGGEDEEEDADTSRRGYRRRYSGHRNDQTVKQVGFEAAVYASSGLA